MLIDSGHHEIVESLKPMRGTGHLNQSEQPPGCTEKVLNAARYQGNFSHHRLKNSLAWHQLNELRGVKAIIIIDSAIDPTVNFPYLHDDVAVLAMPQSTLPQRAALMASITQTIEQAIPIIIMLGFIDHLDLEGHLKRLLSPNVAMQDIHAAITSIYHGCTDARKKLVSAYTKVIFLSSPGSREWPEALQKVTAMVALMMVAGQAIGAQSLKKFVEAKKMLKFDTVEKFLSEFGIGWTQEYYAEVTKLKDSEQEELHELLERVTVAQNFALYAAFGARSFMFGPATLLQECWKKPSLRQTLCLAILTMGQMHELLEVVDFFDALMLEKVPGADRWAHALSRARLLDERNSSFPGKSPHNVCNNGTWLLCDKLLSGGAAGLDDDKSGSGIAGGTPKWKCLLETEHA